MFILHIKRSLHIHTYIHKCNAIKMVLVFSFFHSKRHASHGDWEENPKEHFELQLKKDDEM